MKHQPTNQPEFLFGGAGLFLILFVILVWFLSWPLSDRKPKPIPVEKTETFSHKAGVVVRASSIEFLKGMVGMDSKLKKEADKKTKEKETK